jgi:serine/threonine-protein kinase
MEFLEGADLAERVRQSGPLPVEQAVEFALQACEALAEAHGLGIVHRDLKPANLFVVRRADGLDSVKVLDFGISKVTGPGAPGSDMAMTRTDAVLGSPLYMSPEQMIASRDVDARSDIWSLGAILYELLTGRVPFDAETFPELCVKIATRGPPPLRALRANAPPGIEAVILRCLEKDRGKRYRNVAELARALVEFGSERAVESAKRISRVVQNADRSTADAPLPLPSGATSGGTVSTWGHTMATVAGGKAVVGVLVVLVAAAGVAFAFSAARSSGRASAASGASAIVSAGTALGPTASGGSPSTSARLDDMAPASGSAAGVLERGGPPGPRDASVAGRRNAAGPAVGHAAPGGGAAKSAGPPVGAPPTTPAPNCDPPFTVDSVGVKHPKVECL